jgi:hypothetical protein
MSKGQWGLSVFSHPLGLAELIIWFASLPGFGWGQHWKGLEMSVKLHVRGLLASVCLFGVVAGGAVFAQDAVVDVVVADAPAVDAPADDTSAVAPDVVADPALAAEAEAVEPAPAEPARIALAVPAPGEPTGFEDKSQQQLAFEVDLATRRVADYNSFLASFANSGSCANGGSSTNGGYCASERNLLTTSRDEAQNRLDHVNEEIRRRQVVVVDTPEPAPVVLPVAAPAPAPVRGSEAAPLLAAIADATPPREFCAGLAAKGDFSDCGWSYKQSLKQ